LAIIDPYKNRPAIEQLFSAEDWITITPDDDNDLVYLLRAVRPNLAGTIVMVSLRGNSFPFAFAAGETFMCRPVRIMSTGTTPAIGIAGLL
jgi:hypothetical protein